MPTLQSVNRQQMNGVWLTLQHASKKHRKKYFPYIEKAVAKGDLSKEQLALMQDRMLMDEGKPQIYGSQVRNGKVYKLANPEKVNERRAEMGMKPIEDYMAQMGVEYPN